jgi:serine/threonine-protein kinase
VIDHLEALRLSPHVAAAYDHFARFWLASPDASQRNGLMAVELATRACELSGWEDSACLATLAAACAESGQFADAVRWAERAVQRAPAAQRSSRQNELERYRLSSP